MGLALRDPSEPPSLTEHRYLPGRPGTEGQNPHAKHHRRPLSWSTSKLDAAHLEALEALEQGHGPLQGSLPSDFPRHKQHLIKIAQANHRLHREYSKYWQDRSRRTRTHLPKAYRHGHVDSIHTGQALARSGLFSSNSCSQGQEGRGRSRSGSRSRSNSPPSFDRQNAFRDPRTTKKRSYRRTALVSAEEAEVAELYRLGLLYDNDDLNNRHHDEQQVRGLYQMGLLYDDDHERGPGFTLDAISHDGAIYRVNIDARPIKRGRKGGRCAHPTKTEQELPEFEQLPLDLSYAMLSEDPELAAFLNSQPSATEESIPNTAPGVSAPPKRKHTEEDANEPLTAIYELEDDDYSQEDTSDVGNLVEFLDNLNNHGNALEGGEEDEPENWAFINNNDGYDYDNGSNADGILMTAADEQEAWIHIHHHHSSDLGAPPKTEAYEAGHLKKDREEKQDRITKYSG